MRIAIEGIGMIGHFAPDLKTFINIIKKNKELKKKVSFIKSDTTKLNDYIEKKKLRRIDHFSRISLLSACMALDNSRLLNSSYDDMGIIVASAFGPTQTTFAFLDSFLDESDSHSSPTLFSHSVHNAAAAHIAILLGIKGPTHTISQFDMSFPSALITAFVWLSEKRVKRVLLGVRDEFSQVYDYCQQRLVEDFNCKNCEITGDHSIFFILSRDEKKSQHGFISDIKMNNHLTDSSFFISEQKHVFVNLCKKIDLFFHHDKDVFVYPSLFGNHPLSMVFDVVTAALSIKDNNIFRAIKSHLKTNSEDNNIYPQTISCVKTDRYNNYANIVIEK